MPFLDILVIRNYTKYLKYSEHKLFDSLNLRLTFERFEKKNVIKTKAVIWVYGYSKNLIFNNRSKLSFETSFYNDYIENIVKMFKNVGVRVAYKSKHTLKDLLRNPKEKTVRFEMS